MGKASMKRWWAVGGLGLGLCGAASIGATTGCAFTTHPFEPAAIGTPRATSSLEAVLAQPGPAQVETVVAADWAVGREGLVNLDHPKAEAAGLDDGPEPIHIYLHAIRHPTHGLFIVDTGVERALWKDPDAAAIRGMVGWFMNLESMKIHVDTATWLEGQGEPLQGVFLTHLHLDHISGLPDVPRGTPLYAGPGEGTMSSFENVFVQPVIDRAFEGHQPVREWRFAADPEGRFDGLLDIFGDGSVWAIHVPGHTPGSTAYLARTPKGPVLLVGDACHTSWGWDNGVEPGAFSHDLPKSADSLARLQAFVAAHPEIEVRLGHQPHGH